MSKFSHIVICFVTVVTISLHAIAQECGDPPNKPANPAEEVNKEDVAVKNDYSKVVKKDDRQGVTYLTFINGSSPKPNKCGLNPSNKPAEWTGWGGPLDGDNVTIGEGVGTRNPIVIGGVLFERGIGTHAAATVVYDLTGGKYVQFSAMVGMSDEKDPGECGKGGTSEFIFEVDGKEMAKTPVLGGVDDDGNNMPPHEVLFDLPTNAKKLTITITEGNDGAGCDHSALGDAKLLTAQSLAVEPIDKLSTIWGEIKVNY